MILKVKRGFDEETPIIKSRAIEPVIPGSVASPSLVAYIKSQKYINAMPLCRQEKDFEKLGIDISRQNMANWVIKSSNEWLTSIYYLMKVNLIEEEVLHTDETTLQVLKESVKPTQLLIYNEYWVLSKVS